MSNQWEINEWGSSLDLGWLPFTEEEVVSSMYFTSKDIATYFLAKDIAYHLIAEDADFYFNTKKTTYHLIANDTYDYFTSKGES